MKNFFIENYDHEFNNFYTFLYAYISFESNFAIINSYLQIISFPDFNISDIYIYIKEVQWKRNAQKHFLYNISMENNEGGEEEANDERRSPLRASEEIAYQEFYLQNEILRDCFIRYPLFHGII